MADKGRTYAGSGAVYGLGFIGALVYFIQQADGFWSFVLAILKTIVWPALLTWRLMDFVNL